MLKEVLFFDWRVSEGRERERKGGRVGSSCQEGQGTTLVFDSRRLQVLDEVEEVLAGNGPPPLEQLQLTGMAAPLLVNARALQKKQQKKSLHSP